MGNELTKIDFISFIKRNYKVIVVIAALVSVLSLGYLIYSDYFFEDEETTEINDESGPAASIETLLQMDEEDLTMEESFRLEEYLNQGAYYFSMFIENEDSKAFNRSNLLKEFLIEEDVVTGIESSLGYTLAPSPEQIIETEYNSSNVLMTVYFRTGDMETSEEIANAYYAYIDNENLDLFRRRTVHFLDTPEPVVQEESDAMEEVEEVNESTNNETDTGDLLSTILEIVFAVLISLLFGTIFGVVGAIIISYFSNKVSSIYNHQLNNQDIAVNLTDKRADKKQSILHAVLYPPVNQKLLLVEDESTLKDIKGEFNKDTLTEGQKVVVASSISKVDPRLNFEEVVILSEVGKTSKKWYREQSNQLKLYHVPKKVIKI